jgi:hypothetical protein
MTEGYGSGYGDEGGQRPSGRGAVTERLARQDREGAHEADVTDEAAEESQESRESSGAFEPAAPTADPPAEATGSGSASIFDVDERARREDQHPTGYEPPVADTDAEPSGPRGETIVTEPGEAREEPAATPAGDADAAPGPADITPTPVPAPEPSADTPAPQGLAEPAAAADTPAAETAAAAEIPAAAATPAAAGTSASLLGSLDAADIRTRFLDIQAGFVDEPRQAVEEAGRFVDDLVRQVAEALEAQRGQLAGATAEGSTEDLRLALRAYRQFVDRLLGMAAT